MGLLDDAQSQLKQTCNILGVSENYYRFLSHPQRTVIVNFPVRMDDGHIKMFEGYRVLHANVLGPGKGGFRLDSHSSLEDIQALAMLMTWKCALIGLPLGGAKGSVICEPKTLSKRETERVVRKYTTSMINVIGPKQDIPSPDLNTGAQVMAWMMDAYSMGIGATTPSVVTGKPIEIGGIQGRNRAVGLGLSFILRDFARKEAQEIRDQKVVIQGLGHVGKNVASAAQQFGAKIIALSDSSTGIYDPEGLDVNDVIAWKEEHGTLATYERASKISNAELLTLECDALIPCATQHQITKDNVHDLKCKLIIEGANNPTTSEADAIIEEKHITLIPDLISNAGGLIVSYFEWVQDLSALQWSMDRVARELEKIILQAFDRVYQIKQEHAVSYRRAAYMVAIEKVVNAVKYRGIYP